MSKKKQLIGAVLGIVLCGSLVGCSWTDKWIYSLNGEKLYEKEITAFGMLYAHEYNVNNTEKLQEEYESGQTYEEYHKKQFEDTILSTVLIYREAQTTGMTLSDEEKEQAKEKAKQIIDEYGEEWMQDHEVSDSDIEKICEMEALGDRYIKDLSGETTDEEKEEQRYIKVYQVSFPTVEFDQDGMVKSNQDGTLVKKSAAEQEKMRTDAEDYVWETKQNAQDMDKQAKMYDKTVEVVEKYLYYNDLEKEYKEAVDQLAEGEISEVISSEYGYYVIRLLEADAKDYAKTIVNYDGQKEFQEKKDAKMDELLTTYVGDDKKYRNDEKWEEIEFTNFLIENKTTEE